MFSLFLSDKSLQAFISTQQQLIKELSSQRKEFKGQMQDWMHTSLNTSIQKLEMIKRSLHEDSKWHDIHKTNLDLIIQQHCHLKDRIFHKIETRNSIRSHLQRLAMGVFTTFSLLPGVKASDAAFNDGAATSNGSPTTVSTSSVTIKSDFEHSIERDMTYQSDFTNFFAFVDEQTALKGINDAISGILSKLRLPYLDTNGEMTYDGFFERLTKIVKESAPGAKLYIAGGVVRSVLGYIYSELYKEEQRALRDQGNRADIEKDVLFWAVMEKIEHANRFDSLDVLGVGSDLDVLIEFPEGFDEQKKYPAIDEIRAFINSARDKYQMEYSAVNNTLVPMGDVKEYDKQIRETMAQGGSNLDWLAFPVHQDFGIKMREHTDLPHIDGRPHPGIMNSFIRGQTLYTPEREGHEDLDKVKQKRTGPYDIRNAIRALRPLLELPFLSPTAQAWEVLKGDLEKLTVLDSHGTTQLQKMIRNARFSGGRNRFSEAAGGDGSDVDKFIKDLFQKLNIKFPEFQQHTDIKSRKLYDDGRMIVPGGDILHREGLLIPHAEFREKYTEGGVVYHGTKDSKNFLNMMRNGMLTSAVYQGAAAFGRGVYTAQNKKTASDYTGSVGVLLTLPIKFEGLRVVEWETVKQSDLGKRLLQEAPQSTTDAEKLDYVFKVLAEKYHVDIIINTHVLIQNMAAVKLNNQNLIDAFKEALKLNMPLLTNVLLKVGPSHYSLIEEIWGYMNNFSALEDIKAAYVRILDSLDIQHLGFLRNILQSVRSNDLSSSSMFKELGAALSQMNGVCAQIILEKLKDMSTEMIAAKINDYVHVLKGVKDIDTAKAVLEAFDQLNIVQQQAVIASNIHEIASNLRLFVMGKIKTMETDVVVQTINTWVPLFDGVYNIQLAENLLEAFDQLNIVQQQAVIASNIHEIASNLRLFVMGKIKTMETDVVVQTINTWVPLFNEVSDTQEAERALEAFDSLDLPEQLEIIIDHASINITTDSVVKFYVKQSLRKIHISLIADTVKFYNFTLKGVYDKQEASSILDAFTALDADHQQAVIACASDLKDTLFKPLLIENLGNIHISLIKDTVKFCNSLFVYGDTKQKASSILGAFTALDAHRQKALIACTSDLMKSNYIAVVINSLGKVDISLIADTVKFCKTLFELSYSENEATSILAALTVLDADHQKAVIACASDLKDTKFKAVVIRSLGKVDISLIADTIKICNSILDYTFNEQQTESFLDAFTDLDADKQKAVIACASDLNRSSFKTTVIRSLANIDSSLIADIVKVFNSLLSGSQNEQVAASILDAFFGLDENQQKAVRAHVSSFEKSKDKVSLTGIKAEHRVVILKSLKGVKSDAIENTIAAWGHLAEKFVDINTFTNILQVINAQGLDHQDFVTQHILLTRGWRGYTSTNVFDSIVKTLKEHPDSVTQTIAAWALLLNATEDNANKIWSAFTALEANQQKAVVTCVSELQKISESLRAYVLKKLKDIPQEMLEKTIKDWTVLLNEVSWEDDAGRIFKAFDNLDVDRQNAVIACVSDLQKISERLRAYVLEKLKDMPQEKVEKTIKDWTVLLNGVSWEGEANNILEAFANPKEDEEEEDQEKLDLEKERWKQAVVKHTQDLQRINIKLRVFVLRRLGEIKADKIPATLPNWVSVLHGINSEHNASGILDAFSKLTENWQKAVVEHISSLQRINMEWRVGVLERLTVISPDKIAETLSTWVELLKDVSYSSTAAKILTSFTNLRVDRQNAVAQQTSDLQHVEEGLRAFVLKRLKDIALKDIAETIKTFVPLLKGVSSEETAQSILNAFAVLNDHQQKAVMDHQLTFHTIKVELRTAVLVQLKGMDPQSTLQTIVEGWPLLKAAHSDKDADRILNAFKDLDKDKKTAVMEHTQHLTAIKAEPRAVILEKLKVINDSDMMRTSLTYWIALLKDVYKGDEAASILAAFDDLDDAQKKVVMAHTSHSTAIQTKPRAVILEKLKGISDSGMMQTTLTNWVTLLKDVYNDDEAQSILAVFDNFNPDRQKYVVDHISYLHATKSKHRALVLERIKDVEPGEVLKTISDLNSLLKEVYDEKDIESIGKTLSEMDEEQRKAVISSAADLQKIYRDVIGLVFLRLKAVAANEIATEINTWVPLLQRVYSVQEAERILDKHINTTAQR